MADEQDDIRKIKHDLANPLSGILAEAQILLLDADKLPPDVVESHKQIEDLARRMRGMLQNP